MRCLRSVISLLIAGALVAVGATPSSAATEPDWRRGKYAGYTAEIAQPALMTGILQAPAWRQCNFSQTKAITSTLGLVSPTGGRAVLEVYAFCYPESGYVAQAYLSSGSDIYQLDWPILARDRIRLELDLDAGIIRGSNADRSQSEEHDLPASFEADHLIARSQVTTPDVGHRFVPYGITDVTVDGVSLAHLDPTRLKQVYQGGVIASPTEINEDGDFSIRPGA